MAKYLVTGGCGFIGSHVVDLLLTRGHQVRIVDNLVNSSKKYLPASAELLLGSITDEALMKQALKGVDGVFHLAAMVSVVESIVQWHRNHLVNCSATVHLFERAQGLPIVFASSAAVYGDAPGLPHSETTPPRPLSPYAVDKLTCEMQAQLAWQLHSTPSACFRFFNVYGPRQNPSSPYSGVISKFADLIGQQAPLTIFGDGEQRRDFIYVKDIASMLVHTMEMPLTGADVYNLCTGKDISINDLADLMGQIAGVQVEKIYAPARPGEIRISCGDPSKTLHKLGLKATTPLAQGLTELMHATSRS